MGVNVVPFASYAQALACVEDAVELGKKSFWVAINPLKVYRAWNDPCLLAALRKADVGICDGIGVSMAARILHGRRVSRCTGCDLFFEMMPLATSKGWGVFLLGATAASNERACRNLRKKHPGLKIVGRQDGYFDDSAEIIRQINDSGAKLLFVGMGTPKQEHWIAEHRDEIDAAFCMGVGGSFNIASGTVRRAPRIFRRTGTEFLYQLATEPWRFRQQMTYPAFVLRVLKERSRLRAKA